MIEQSFLAQLVAQCRPLTANGKLADYIPALQRADPSCLGVCAAEEDRLLSAGDAEVRFSIQSIVKVLAFTCCLMDSGPERVFEKVSVEPTGERFDSITSLETKNFNRPLNPMINAGAIACMTLVSGGAAERVLEFARLVSGNSGLEINQEIYQSEKATGSRNRALTYYMKSTGIIDGDVETILDDYFKACSIEMDCRDLARTGLFLARDGRLPGQAAPLIPRPVMRAVKAAMMMCGMYDESGKVAVAVGLPSKSGVGGGILSLVPGQCGIGVYGPALNEKGSSAAGLALLEKLSEHYDLSVF